MNTHPLVSYCVKCFNQEQYIGKALEAAFAQTYEPLEILIGDDCSTDGSMAGMISWTLTITVAR